MSFASWKDRKAIAQFLPSLWRAENADAGLAALEAFEESHWGRKYPAIGQSWRRHWEQVIPDPPDHLHHECDRGAERKIAPGGAHAWSLPG
jgi:transposase-like protein